MRTQPKYYIETDALYGEDCSDDGRYFNYDIFVAEGDTLDELLDNCSGFKVDQDGGEGPEVMLGDVSGHAYNRLVEAVIAEFRRQGGTP